MGLSRRQFTQEFKLAAGARGLYTRSGTRAGSEPERTAPLGSSHLMGAAQRWHRKFRQGPGNAFPGNGKTRWSEGRVAEFERKVGQ